MNALGPLAKLAAAFIGKQPEDQLHPRGFLGIELAEASGRIEGRDRPGRLAGVRGGREAGRPPGEGR